LGVALLAKRRNIGIARQVAIWRLFDNNAWVCRYIFFKIWTTYVSVEVQISKKDAASPEL
jgi:hypothetical protein